MSTSTVTGTIQDPSGQTFNNGFWQLIFKPAYSSPGPSTDGGVSFTKIYGGNLDNAGSFSQANVNRNDTISPLGSKWTLVVTPNASTSAFSVDLNINSPAFDVTALINAIIPTLTVQAIPVTHAYKDSEVIPVPGSGGLYYDVTLKTLKVWDAASAAWQSFDTNGAVTFAKLDGTNMPFTGQVAGKLGSTASPSYSFITDLTTGLYRPAASRIGISIGGIEHLRIGNFLSVGNADPIGWSSTADSTGALDTGLSRISASLIGIGNGVQGDFSASFSANAGFFTSATRLANNGMYQFSSTASGTGSPDTGLSRTAAGQVSVGNGTAGDPSGTYKSAKTITGNINNVFFIDGTKYAQTDTGVKAALADAITQNGGRVVIPDGVSITKSSQWVLGNSSGTGKPQVELEIGTGSSIVETTVGGVDGFLVNDGCGIIGHGGAGIGAGNAGNKPSVIILGVSCNLNALIAPGDRTGGQEALYCEKFSVLGNGTAVVASAIFDIQGIFIGTYFRDIYTSNIPCKIVRLRPGTTVKILSDIIFDNCNLDASGVTGGLPLSVENIAASQIANITFFDGAIQHAGTGQPLVNMDGLGVSYGISHISFIRVHFESTAGGGTQTIKLRDVDHISIFNSVDSGPGVTDLFAISESVAGLTHNINIIGTTVSGTYTNLVNNTCDGTTVKAATSNGVGIDMLDYKYKGVMVSDAILTYGPSKAYVAAGDLTQGIIHLLPLAPADGQMTAITTSSGAAWGANANAKFAQAGIYWEGSSVFGTKMHFATTNNFATGAIFRWQIDQNGNFLAETDKTLDIGAAAANRPRDIYFRRPKVTAGTALVTGDFGTLTGWGTTASVSAVSGNDAAGSFTIASAGTGQTADATVVLTFHDGTWTNAPIVIACRGDDTAPTGVDIAVSAVTATTVTFKFSGLPVAASSYKFYFHCMGI